MEYVTLNGDGELEWVGEEYRTRPANLGDLVGYRESLEKDLKNTRRLESLIVYYGEEWVAVYKKLHQILENFESRIPAAQQWLDNPKSCGAWQEDCYNNLAENTRRLADLREQWGNLPAGVKEYFEEL